jgi:uncharacterized cupin superfamily protein
MFSQPLAEWPFMANSYLFVTEAGNVVIDPLPVDRFAHSQIEQLGGIARILLMTAGREAASQALAARYGATIIAKPQNREALFSGMVAIQLPDQKRDHEFAIGIPGERAVVVGDAIFGSPAGALSMSPAEEYADVRAAALGLRRILREDPETLLVSFGSSVYTSAYAALYQLLYSRAGAEIHRINLDELEFSRQRDEHENEPAPFRCLDAEVGFAIGARRLGYRVSTLAPGQRFCPLHSHAREEEMFLVLDGEPSVRTLSGTIRCRRGDFVALPVGHTGTHQLLNESSAPATVLLLARNERVEACYYPDSDKLLIDTQPPILDGQPSIMVQASPTLEYFFGEE